jgi:hypothetical protein
VRSGQLRFCRWLVLALGLLTTLVSAQSLDRRIEDLRRYRLQVQSALDHLTQFDRRSATESLANLDRSINYLEDQGRVHRDGFAEIRIAMSRWEVQEDAVRERLSTLVRLYTDRGLNVQERNNHEIGTPEYNRFKSTRSKSPTATSPSRSA